MYIVTGGAGFIGSAIIWELNNRGISEILAVDDPAGLSDVKKENLKFLKYKEFRGKEDFIKELKCGSYKDIRCILHMGACSTTTERNREYIMDTNYRYSMELAAEAVKNNIQFIYASSAATYGDGTNGFNDEHSKIETLEPMNLYGESKQLFDMWVRDEGLLDKIVGLKYFNVYGPNEYHKGEMKSFIVKAYSQIRDSGKVRLFKSYKDKYAHGEQMRDFIYVKDAVDMTLQFMEHEEVKGIFNIGTGNPRTWNDLVRAVFKASGNEEDIEYIDMPENIKDQYQYYTCADMNKFKNAGLNFSPCSLEEGIKDYVDNYLANKRHLGTIDS
ncbi:ADP-glyceromanno-heptose 6-epimerase [Elusimicrobiota bacterium]